MPVETDVISAEVRKTVGELGLTIVRVDVTIVDPAPPALFITVVSPDFDGQSHLDRELHIRPAVIRALHGCGLIRASSVIEPLTPAEEELQSKTENPLGTLDAGESEQERIGRAEWRTKRTRVVNALQAAFQSVVEELDEAVYLATRDGITTERIAVAFAPSPKATTVDLRTRAALQTLKNSGTRINSFYYLAPFVLEAPFANQPPAKWIEVSTDLDFLHRLNGSHNLAQTQFSRIEADFGARPGEQRGPVVTPDVRSPDKNFRLAPFFDFVRQWAKGDQASLLILMAPAGHGKTTITKELTRLLSSEFLSSPTTASVPLLVPFEEVRRTVDFEALLHKKLAELKAGNFGAFSELLRANGATLVVDGFDELADDAGFAVAENQVRSMRRLLDGRAKVILAGRSVFTHEFGGEDGVTAKVRSLLGDIDVQTLEILPFDDDKIREYVMSRQGLSMAQKQTVLDFTQASTDNETLASNPLFLQILCSLASASEGLSKAGGIGSLDSLIEQVCEREERRQNLGIGVPRQFHFLEDLAAEAVGKGGRSIPASDVRILAKLVCDEIGAGEAVVEKLVDHAFLTTSTAGMCSFIHPLVRDVLAGIAVVKALRGVPATQLLSKKDLPLGTTQFVARALANGTVQLPKLWIRRGSGAYEQERRNYFRLSCERVRYQTGGDPREWRGLELDGEDTVCDLNLSGMILDGISLDGLKLNGCDLADALLEECDLRGALFSECQLRGTTFVDCRSDQLVDFPDSNIVGVQVRRGGALFQPSDRVELREALKTQTKALTDAGPKVSAGELRTHAQRLLSIVLRLLVSSDGTKFYEIPADSLRFDNEAPMDKAALDKVVAPLVVSRLCQTTFVKKSEERHTIARPWKRVVGDFVRTQAAAPLLNELIARIGSKAARYLEG